MTDEELICEVLMEAQEPRYRRLLLEVAARLTALTKEVGKPSQSHPQADPQDGRGGEVGVLPATLPGHWDTPAGHEMATEYAKLTRAKLGNAHRSDFAVANDVYMADRGDLDLIVHQTAAKERIRWLSVQLALAQAALAAAPLVEGWQPIETAPKDGTRVDVWAFWPETLASERTANAYFDRTEGDWYLGVFMSHQYMMPPIITHWMPLPPPPEGNPS
jgi:hypothetical protein